MAGQEIVELDTDTALVSIPSPISGMLEQIAHGPRLDVAGQLIGRIHSE